MSAVHQEVVPLAQSRSFLIPTSYGDIELLSRKICAANWVPKSYLDRNGQPNQCMVEVAIMHGIEVGLTPIAAIQSIAVINGMPTIWGDAMLALVRVSGLLEDISETYEGEGDDMTAICRAVRRGQVTEVIGRFSVAMAKKAGLWGKQGPWTQYPARMLKLRARSWCLRDGFGDVLRGLYMAEEAMDMIDVTPDEPAPPKPKREDFKPKAATVTDVAPTPEEEVEADRLAREFVRTGGQTATDEDDATDETGGDESHDPETGEIRDAKPAADAEPVEFWQRDSLEIVPIPVGTTGKNHDWTVWQKEIAQRIAEAASIADIDALARWNDEHITALSVRYMRLGDEVKTAFAKRRAILDGGEG